jgi:methylated-DNA-[protein]-cysteine S-methyltransferase
MPTIYWTRLEIESWPLIIAATKKGLCFVGSLNENVEELAKWQQRKLPSYTLQQNDEQLRPYFDWFEKYFNQEFAPFSLPMDLLGTAFQQKVWQALQQIPLGQTSSYSDIAEMILQPTAVRAVGGAIGANPIAIVVPCHRVIGKNRSLTGYRGGIPMKIRLLENENIIL